MNKKNEPIHHCMIVHACYPHDETRVEREAQALIQHGIEVDVICLQQSPEEARYEVAAGVRVHRLPVRRNKKRGLFGQLLEYLAFFALAFFKAAGLQASRQYAVVETHNLPDFLVFAALWPKLMGAQVIHNIHDVMPEFYATRFQTGMQSWPVRLVRWQERISCKFADHIITVTELWRQTLIERGVPPDKISVVMNVADSKVFHAPAQPSNRDSASFKLIYHGTLAQRYGIDLLLQAVALVRDRIPGIHLTIHGRGEFYQQLVDLAQKLGLGDHVTFSTSMLPMADLASFICQADLGVVPYRRDLFTDGILPTKLMEYTAVHIPVIVARTPAIEAYFDEEMVYFFAAGDANSLADAILCLYRDRPRLDRLALRSNRFNEQYAWEKIASDYRFLVERLASA